MELALKRGKTAVIVGAQWGDEGKGKIVDVLSENFSVVARYAGGHNAGHTVIINGKKFVLQLVPCGVLRPGCRSVIGNGVVLDPMAFLKEVGALRQAGVAAVRARWRGERGHSGSSMQASGSQATLTGVPGSISAAPRPSARGRLTRSVAPFARRTEFWSSSMAA